MIPVRWSPPSIWEEPEPPGSSVDILAEERERRTRGRGRIRRFWPGNWLTGRSGVFALCFFLASGLGFLGFQHLDFGDPYAPVSSSPPGSVFPEEIRSLTAAEYSLASRYGVPLHLGPGGRPVVEVNSTKDVRELTAFEVELDSLVSYIPSRRGLIIQVPGPKGQGMWWMDDSDIASLRPLASFTRFSWRDRQERELRRTVRGIVLGLLLLNSVDFEFWERGLGEPLLDVVSQIKGPYPPAQRGHWGAVPGLWVCDRELEWDLHQGVTPGCPGSGYREVLQEVWIYAGAVTDRLEGLGRYVVYMDGMDSADLHQSEARLALSYEILDLFQDARDLDRALARLRGVSGEWGLPISVGFMGGP